jgi:PAS domain S-box-containing protein
MSSNRLQETVEQFEALLSDLERSTSIDDVYDRAICAAETLIEFDAAAICTVDGGVFEPRAVRAAGLIPGEPLAAADGIAGRTRATNRTHVVDDLRDEPDAAPSSDRFRSVLSISLDVDGIVQFHAHDRGAFSADDRRLGELLVAVIGNVRARITSETELGRQRDQFAALFENVPDAALQYRLADGRLVVEAVNSSFVRRFGHNASDAVGKPISELLTADGGHAGPELACATTPGRRADVEVVRETADGPRSFLLRNVPIATDDGTTRGYLIYTDLRELKARERELKDKNERLNQFASIVSHDLRNPLNVADGYLELAMERETTEELEQIRQAHERMDRLIDDVLMLAQDGELEISDSVSLESAARQAWSNVSTGEATLEVDAQRTIEADRGRLLRLLENLFRNAIEHAGPTVRVRVETIPDGFAVDDDGPGIPPEEHERVFDFGYSTQQENTGIGLAIVRQVSDAHGWSVELSSTDGTRFEFRKRDDEPRMAPETDEAEVAR